MNPSKHPAKSSREERPGDLELTMPAEAKHVVVASHRRSGTHLVIDTIRKNFLSFQKSIKLTQPFYFLYLNIDQLSRAHHRCLSISSADKILSSSPRTVLKTHSLPLMETVDDYAYDLVPHILNSAIIIYCVRDVRSVLASQHLYEKTYNKHVAQELKDFIREEIGGLSRPAYWAAHVRAWMDEPDVTVIRFEDIIRDPTFFVKTMSTLFNEEPIVVSNVLPSPIKNQYDLWRCRILGLLEASNIPGRLARQRRPANWKHTLDSNDLNFVKDHAGEIMATLGYD